MLTSNLYMKTKPFVLRYLLQLKLQWIEFFILKWRSLWSSLKNLIKHMSMRLLHLLYRLLGQKRIYNSTSLASLHCIYAQSSAGQDARIIIFYGIFNRTFIFEQTSSLPTSGSNMISHFQRYSTFISSWKPYLLGGMTMSVTCTLTIWSLPTRRTTCGLVAWSAALSTRSLRRSAAGEGSGTWMRLIFISKTGSSPSGRRWLVFWGIRPSRRAAVVFSTSPRMAKLRPTCYGHSRSLTLLTYGEPWVGPVTFHSGTTHTARGSGI